MCCKNKAMQSVIFVDSRGRTEGTDSSFQIELRESLHLAEHGMRVDKLRLTNSFLTTDLGKHIYYKNGSGGITSYALPEQAYTGTQLAAAMQAATSRTTTYDPNTNAITQDAVASQMWLSDEQLQTYTTGFPSGATSSAPLSINAVLGTSFNYYVTSNPATFTIKWNFVKMSPYDYLFLRSRRLTVSSEDPNGRHDVIACIPLTKGIGAVETASSPDGVYLKLPPDLVLRNIDFSLTDYLGNNVDLRGRPISFELCFD
jgi:hypothetical protein